jgi:hypothetical protein
MTHKQHVELNKQVESFAIQNPFYERIGEVFQCPDSSNVYILTKDGRIAMLERDYLKLIKE